MEKNATVITINVQKGGVGKTTTVHELGANLTKRGNKVLNIDLDPQMNLSRISNAAINEGYYTIYEALKKECKIEDCIQETANYDIAIAHKKFGEADKEFSNFEDIYKLTDLLEDVRSKYDYILIDTPPSLGILPSMGLTAADYVIIPCEASSSGVQGLGQLYERIEVVKNPQRGSNKKLKVAGMLLTMYQSRTNFAQSVHRQLKVLAENKNTKVFQTFIRSSIAVDEAQGWKQSLIEYAPNSNPAIDYDAFTDELLETIQSQEGEK